jgi:hypothetical protein
MGRPNWREGPVFVCPPQAGWTATKVQTGEEEMNDTPVISMIAELQDVEGFREQYWEGRLSDYPTSSSATLRSHARLYQRL